MLDFGNGTFSKRVQAQESRPDCSNLFRKRDFSPVIGCQTYPKGEAEASLPVKLLETGLQSRLIFPDLLIMRD